MTLTQFLTALNIDVTINVTKGNEKIASFLKSTYASIDATILAYTVTSISFTTGVGEIKSVDIVVA